MYCITTPFYIPVYVFTSMYTKYSYPTEFLNSVQIWTFTICNPMSFYIVCLQHNSYPFLPYISSQKRKVHYFPPHTQVYFYLLSPRSGHRFYRHTTRSPHNGPGAQSDRVRCPLKKKKPKHPQLKSHWQILAIHMLYL